MNKHIKHSLLLSGLFGLSLALASCEKLIEIPSAPSSMTQDEQFTDSLSTLSAVAGVYAYDSQKGFGYTDGRLTYLTAFSADELSGSLVNDNQQFYSYTLTPLNESANSLWSSAYRGIYQINALLAKVDGNENLSNSFQQQVIGEMKVMRALYYFNLVNLFGEVPLILGTDYNKNNRKARNTVAEVYQQLDQDLQDAISKLQASYPSAGRARPNLYTAQALMAKVQLYQENWQAAYDHADAVIASGIYSLVSDDVNGVFLSGSSEAIWQIPGAQAFSSGVADAKNFVPYSPTMIPSYLLTPNLLNAFEAGDQRLNKWVGRQVLSNDTGEQTYYYPLKYKNPIASTTPTEDQMILRLAEVYLIRAEAAAHLNKLDEALADVDLLRQRAGINTPNPADPSAQEAVLAAIAHERQVELFCEWGNRWYDLKRTGKASSVLGESKTGFTEHAALYPVPQQQRLLNVELTQNLGY